MSKILITGGAGFIGSNLVDYFLERGHEVVCLDNLATGFEHNIAHNFGNRRFRFLKGDIRDLSTCREAVKGCDVLSHQAALGSVPRSIKDPITSNDVNIGGFVNMLVAARDEEIQRFVYAASSSTYGDSQKLPKLEDEIGKPLSPYAITKYVNELYADVFSKSYGMQCIGLRYFNVFGRRQDPNGAYAAVIPLWVKQLMEYKRPVINGDGSYSRDFTYIENVIQANDKALFTPAEKISDASRFAEVFNIAYGGNTNLIQLFEALRENLAKYDEKIAGIDPLFGPVRAGDIPHSQASIEKAKRLLDYQPKYDARQGFAEAAEWYFQHL
ncbi:MAG TPA: SDR family oxidoreductase [Candidatus Marinimicrobia bacterium]|mgnify:CR=1 FL=1|nr:SDR family oxidoreductase [Candidatus Neomarinimicrobiota bacterium]